MNRPSRIQLMSDLHIEHSKASVPAAIPGVDVVVIAGDTAVPLSASLHAIRAAIDAAVPVVVVAGNHEFYRSELPTELAQGRDLARTLGIHFLENDTEIIAGTRFIGATLWTNYALFGDALRPLAMAEARERMNDHKLIKWSKQPWLRFRPHEALRLHWQSISYIEAQLFEPFDGPTVVVTHHAPCPDSLHPDWQNAYISAAYASDLSELIASFQPDAWLHGHCHRKVDYRIGSSRIVSNPCGYPGEVTGFDPALVLEIGS